MRLPRDGWPPRPGAFGPTARLIRAADRRSQREARGTWRGVAVWLLVTRRPRDPERHDPPGGGNGEPANYRGGRCLVGALDGGSRLCECVRIKSSHACAGVHVSSGSVNRVLRDDDLMPCSLGALEAGVPGVRAKPLNYMGGATARTGLLLCNGQVFTNLGSGRPRRPLLADS